jgi:LAO/AO transport system ATPase
MTPPRILIAKAGLDGHDRGALLVCLALRDAGCEVLYTGIRNTPARIAATAIQEDVDGVGLSSLSGAHRALFPRVVERLRDGGGRGVSVFAGGIFPQADRKFLIDSGVERLFDPGSPLSETTAHCIEAARARWAAKAELNGAPPARALAARLTAIESTPSDSPEATSATTDPRVVGLTGPGGTGKSTLIDALIAAWRARGRRIAAICVDPTSARSGGAFLGDRIRMQRHADDEGVFIRSVATRGAPGGVPVCVGAMARALREAGYDWVLVESIGAGQDQVEIRRRVGRLVLAAAPGQGDAVQVFKSNALELADLVAVTRADRGGAELYARELGAALRASRRRDDVPVLVVSGQRGLGVDALIEALERGIEVGSPSR